MTDQTTIEKFRKIMITMYQGYPEYTYYGLIEKEFKEGTSRVIQLLKDDGIIIYGLTEKGLPSYKLTKKGVDFAISMINLNFSKKTYKSNKEVHLFTLIITFLSMGTFIVGVISVILLAKSLGLL